MAEILKNTINMSLNSINKTDNPSQLEGIFIVHDFEKSWNNAVITKEVCEENMHYLVGQYICCKYISKEENNGLDALGSHEAYIDINRDTGEEMMATNTVPIGHITEVYIANGIKSDGTEGEVFYCKATLWLNKFYNVLSFLNEMVENGVNVPCSVEYGYSNFVMQDGVRYDQSPIYYEALCILNPIDRGSIKAVLPAYDSSKFEGFSFNEAIQADLENSKSSNEKEGVEMENIFKKALNSISLGEQRDKILEAMSKVLTAEEFNNAWIGMYGIYPDYVAYESVVDNEWKSFKIPYSLNESDEIVLDMEGKVEVQYELVEKEIQTSLNEKLAQLEETNESLNGRVSELEEENKKIVKLEEDLATEKETQVSLNEKIAELETQVEELAPFKAEAEQLQYNAKLEEAKTNYETRFVKLNAKETFETEEIQKLIEDTISNDIEVSTNARTQLADTLIDLASAEKEEDKQIIVEQCGKKIEGLVPSSKTMKNEYCGINLG